MKHEKRCCGQFLKIKYINEQQKYSISVITMETLCNNKVLKSLNIIFQMTELRLNSFNKKKLQKLRTPVNQHLQQCDD